MSEHAPQRFRKRPVEIEAARWWRNGDHPDDNTELGERTEGAVVRYHRHPPVDPDTGEVSAAPNAVQMGELPHNQVPEPHRRNDCDVLMHRHGWIDTPEGGHTVCPGDWIVRGVQGEFYPCKPDIFEQTYEPVDQDQEDMC